MTQSYAITQATSECVMAYNQFILNLLKMVVFYFFIRLRGGTYCRGNCL